MKLAAEAFPYCNSCHNAPVRPGIDVAVPARLVADLADVDLEDLDAARAEHTAGKPILECGVPPGLIDDPQLSRRLSERTAAAEEREGSHFEERYGSPQERIIHSVPGAKR